jgi:hypothetical protein
LNALFVSLLMILTGVLSVALGVFGAYCAIHAVLTAVNPARSSSLSAVFLPEQSRAIGD